MNKPVKCGCGGEAEIVFDGNGEMSGVAVKCKKCGITTAYYLDDTQKAIQAWNRAMGERTAKVKLQDICWEDIRRYKEGMCASCGRSVYNYAKYCDECGCRLEWDE